MKSGAKELAIWTRGRFLAIVGFLFVLQIGLIALFGARGTVRTPPPPPSTQFQAMGTMMGQEQLVRLFFASDPTVFALPSAHGFSGRAWMEQAPPRFQAINQPESPRWLALNTDRLGTVPNVPGDTDATAPLPPARLEIQELEPPPPFLTPVIVPTQSIFHIEGAMGKRLIGPALVLRSWTSPTRELLSNTVVQIAVNQAGDVMAARLWSRSGSPEADGEAVAKASGLRFRAAAGAPITWARTVFHWQTTFSEAAGTAP